MHGDISRDTFDATKAFSSLRQQQGRPLVDADYNELVDILLHDERESRIDIIGRTGAPETDAGFEITVASGALRIGAGRFYVDGIRVDHRPGAATAPFSPQPFYPGVTLPTTAGTYLAYLDVWEQPISAVQDPAIREVALGGADTALRTRTVWQVRLLRVTDSGTGTCGSTFPEWDRLIAGPTARLEARVNRASATRTPCAVPEVAGFTGLQNQLYRVEVHEGNFDPIPASGSNGTASTYKWSRDNGAIIASGARGTATREIIVDRVGPGGVEGLDAGFWVELSDNNTDLSGTPGLLARIDSALDDVITLHNTAAVNTRLGDPAFFVPAAMPQVRRWDSNGSIGVATAWTAIEDGIEIRFTAGTYRHGDFWLIPARTAILPGTTTQVDWPAGSDRAPFGPRHHYARLALLDFTGTTWSRRYDCRAQFSSLVDSTAFTISGGDGQIARSGHFLPQPISVAVTHGIHPVANSRVRFSIVPDPTAGSRGGLRSTAPTPIDTTTSPAIEVLTNAAGLARVWWRLGQAPAPPARGTVHQPEATQQVDAQLLDASGAVTHATARFTGNPLDNLILTQAGGEGQSGIPGRVLDVALRVRVTDGTRPVEGAHVLFSNLNRMVLGTPLDQFSGGSIHASTNVVSTTSWPNGTRTLEAVVRTDADGVAQVQWTLGTETRLPVQRLSATLLADDGTPTDQSTLFIGNLSIASQVAIDPPAILRPLLGGAFEVQRAIEELSRLLIAPIQQVWRLQGTSTRVVLPNGGSVTLGTFAGLELGLSFDLPSLPDVDAALRIECYSDVSAINGTSAILRVAGTLSSPSARRVIWRPTTTARARINAGGDPFDRPTSSFVIRLDPLPGRWGAWTWRFTGIRPN